MTEFNPADSHGRQLKARSGANQRCLSRTRPPAFAFPTSKDFVASKVLSDSIECFTDSIGSDKEILPPLTFDEDLSDRL